MATMAGFFRKRIASAVAPALVLLAAGCAGGRSDWAGPTDAAYIRYASRAGVRPATVEFRTAEGNEVVYAGVAHTFDPDDPALRELESLFLRFRPDVVLHEGGETPVVGERDDAVRRFGEPGLLRHLAAREGVAARNMDLPLVEEARLLAARFHRREVLLYLALRQLAALNELENRTERDARIRSYVVALRDPLGIPQATWNDVELEYRRASGRDLVPDDVDFRTVHPVRGVAALRPVALASLRARDTHMVRVLVEAGRRHRRVLAVAGAAHVVLQERALRLRLDRSRATVRRAGNGSGDRDDPGAH